MLPNQENLHHQTAIDGAAFAARLLQVIHHTRLNQSEFAKRLEVSAAFISDVVRGLKKPGAEFLYSLKAVFGICIDWLLTGEGTMLGASKIDVALFRAIRLQISLAQAAIVDDDAVAQSLLRLIREGLLAKAADHPEIHTYLECITPDDPHLDLALALYNSHLWTTDADTQRRNLLEAAVAHFEMKKPVNKLASLIGVSLSPKTKYVQVNIATTQHILGRDYHEKTP